MSVRATKRRQAGRAGRLGGAEDEPAPLLPPTASISAADEDDASEEFEYHSGDSDDVEGAHTRAHERPRPRMLMQKCVHADAYACTARAYVRTAAGGSDEEDEEAGEDEDEGSDAGTPVGLQLATPDLARPRCASVLGVKAHREHCECTAVNPFATSHTRFVDRADCTSGGDRQRRRFGPRGAAQEPHRRRPARMVTSLASLPRPSCSPSCTHFCSPSLPSRSDRACGVASCVAT